MFGSLGALAGSALGQIGDVLSAPRRALWGALGLPDSGEELLSNTFGMDRDSALTKALGIGAEMLLDPLTYVGLGAGKAASALAGAGKAARGVEALAPMRRAFGVVKDIAPVGEIGGEAINVGRAVGRTPETGELMNAINGFAKQSLETGSKGAYHTGSKLAFLPQGASREAARHESIHGMIDSIVSGAADGAGAPWPMRASAWLQTRQSPFLRGVGEIGDEATAYGLSQKGLLNQIGGAGKFLFAQHPGYVDQIGQVSPLAAKLYGNSRLLGAAAAGTGAGVGGYELYNALGE